MVEGLGVGRSPDEHGEEREAVGLDGVRGDPLLTFVKRCIEV